MTKELLTVEFRYHDTPKWEGGGSFNSKTLTIGIYDTLEEAIIDGNKIIDELSKYFEVRSDDKFSLHGIVGCPMRLVSNTCYSTKGIEYFAKITCLKFENFTETIRETFCAFERYKEFKQKEKDSE